MRVRIRVSRRYRTPFKVPRLLRGLHVDHRMPSTDHARNQAAPGIYTLLPNNEIRATSTVARSSQLEAHTQARVARITNTAPHGIGTSSPGRKSGLPGELEHRQVTVQTACGAGSRPRKSSPSLTVPVCRVQERLCCYSRDLCYPCDP